MLSTSHLVLAPDAAIDLQVHTTYSDGLWMPEQLLEYLAREGFALAAITDHDRPDTAAALQALAHAARMPVLVAAEMTTVWNDGIVDVLCFGSNLDQQALSEVALDVTRRQQENTRIVYDKLCQDGQLTLDQPDALTALLKTPSAQQPHALVTLVQEQHPDLDRRAAGKPVWDAGCGFAATPIGTVIEAAHSSGAVCVIAHPGRTDGFVCFDTKLLDQLRQEVPIDGIEVYYPAHTPERTAMYLAYAEEHDLLISAGSDSHAPEGPPIKYPAQLCRKLLERVGIQVS